MTPFAIKGRYTELVSLRSTIFNEGLAMAQLTIPSLLLPLDAGPNYEYPIPYQGLGSMGVNQLASKLLLALFPATTNFFKLDCPDSELEALGAKGRSEAESGFNQIEKHVTGFVETNGLRIQIFESLKQLLVVGNVLLYFQEDNSLRLFKLDSYVLSRDSSGNVMEIITKEKMDSRMLTPEMLVKYNQQAKKNDVPLVERNPIGISTPEKIEALPQELELYTYAERVDKGRWKITQELNGIVVSEERKANSGYVKADDFPFIPLAYVRTGTDPYGRGFVHEVQGDLYSYEGMTKAIYEGGMAAARTIYLTRPGSVLDKNQLRDAPNLSVLQGMKDDIHVIESGKSGDMKISMEVYASIERRLSQAFLLNKSVQRNAERVSAEEIRFLAQELEQSLGGMHSVLAQTLQLPLIKYSLSKLAKDGKVAKLPKEITPRVTTGIEALSRSKDFESLGMFSKTMVATFGPEVFMAEVNPGEVIKRGVTALGIDPLGLIKTDAEKAEAQAQAQQQQQTAMMADMATRAAPNLAQGMMQPPPTEGQPTE